MKYVLEFGIRGGLHVDNEVFNTREQAERMAQRLVMVFTGEQAEKWVFSKYGIRLTWKNKTHFVSLSKLDGVMRGPASKDLWPKPVNPELLEGDVCEHYS